MSSLWLQAVSIKLLALPVHEKPQGSAPLRSGLLRERGWPQPYGKGSQRSNHVSSHLPVPPCDVGDCASAALGCTPRRRVLSSHNTKLPRQEWYKLAVDTRTLSTFS